MTNKPKPKLEPILTGKALERANKMIAIPEQLFTNDGRSLHILQWEAGHSRAEGVIRVAVHAIIQMSNEEHPNVHVVKP